MTRCLSLILLFFATFSAGKTAAQLSSLREKKIPARGFVKLDSLSIVPHSVFIPGYDSSFYTLDPVNAILSWKKPVAADSVILHYRVFPFRLNGVAKRFSYDSIRNNFIAAPSFNPNHAAYSNPVFNFGKLNYSGSFGRSLSFGNSQNAVFNSQFNLQLSGYLADSIHLAAAITDNNIPIQPDGTTQQLNEFDQVLLQFKKKNWEADLGDIDLRQNQSYFLNFYKRLQGISFRQDFRIGKNTENKILLSGAIAKGKFAQNILAVQEGNQGPYRLQGNNNELYFIVLAGTEKVFIDGVQMQRGQDQDYVIDYNTAEITFTPKHLITKDSRVQVDFEYADRNYLNSMLYISNETDFGKKFKLNIAAYSNTDAKNSPINQPLDNPQKQFLANLGDSIQNAFYPVASQSDSFTTAAIFYKKTDTLYNGIHDSIYVYSTNPDSAKYHLTFVNVGQNKGDYIPYLNNANGNVFIWVAPVNGIRQGSYEAATFLVTPKKQQVISVGAEYALDDKTIVKAELASSKYDVNTFSTLGKSAETGYAGKFSIERNSDWKTAHKSMHLALAAGDEWVDQHFQPVERLHPVEFLRDWGLDLVSNPATEQLPSLSITISDDQNNSLGYQFTGYIRSDGYKGYRNVLTHQQNFRTLHLDDIFNLTNISMPGDKGFYLRPTIALSKSFPSFHHYILGASYAIEHNEIKNLLNDTITPLSFAFETFSTYLKSDPSRQNTWSFTYSSRSDQLPYGKKLVQTDHSNNFNFESALLKNPKEQLRLDLTYRQLFINDTSLTSQKPDNSLLGRVEYIVNEWNGFLTGNALYELGAGQEQKLSFSYIQVPAGQGQYTWNDYNGDGIPQLNEFELALFPDQATYIRVYAPTNEYVKADYNQFNYSLMLNPRALSETIPPKGWKNFLSRFILQSSLQTGKKQLAGTNPVFNPFKGKIQDTSLINLNYSLSNTLSFNRSSSSWGLDLSNTANYDKSLLTYGFESRQFNEWTVKGRVNLARSYTLGFIQKKSTNNLFTPSFGNRNYALQTFSSQPQFTYLSGTKFRVQAGYEFMETKNQLQYGGETAKTSSLSIDSKYNAVQNTSITANFTFSNIDFNGSPNTTVSYVMLDGLLPGKNYIWSLNFTKRLMNNLELSFEYEGRKPGTGRTIHTGRASLRALL